jgi:hypothetical protein
VRIVVFEGHLRCRRDEEHAACRQPSAYGAHPRIRNKKRHTRGTTR